MFHDNTFLLKTVKIYCNIWSDLFLDGITKDRHGLEVERTVNWRHVVTKFHCHSDAIKQRRDSR